MDAEELEELEELEEELEESEELEELKDPRELEEAEEPKEPEKPEGLEEGLEEEPEEELYEIEVDEDDIYAYIVDEDDNEIGFILLNENGEEEEYYYAEGEFEDAGEAPAKSVESRAKSSDDEFDLGITREGVADTTADLNAIYKDGVAVASELKSTFDDITAGFDFLKKK